MDGLPGAEVRQGRDLDLEARLIAEAEAEADAGLLIPAEEVNAWIESPGVICSIAYAATRTPPPINSLAANCQIRTRGGAGPRCCFHVVVSTRLRASGRTALASNTDRNRPAR
jgi:hypothetical protein